MGIKKMERKEYTEGRRTEGPKKTVSAGRKMRRTNRVKRSQHC
jgi:hypothetical protein